MTSVPMFAAVLRIAGAVQKTASVPWFGYVLLRCECRYGGHDRAGRQRCREHLSLAP